jgi:hypothetical protein
LQKKYRPTVVCKKIKNKKTMCRTKERRQQNGC